MKPPANLADEAVRARFESDIQPIWQTEQRTPRSDYIAENKAFHDAIIRAGGNETLAGITNQLQLPLLMFQLNKRLTVTNITASLAEHRAIARAMLDGDAANAKALMHRHLDRARSVACEMPSQVFRNEPTSGGLVSSIMADETRR